jgi:hypothetical protein
MRERRPADQPSSRSQARPVAQTSVERLPTTRSARMLVDRVLLAAVLLLVAPCGLLAQGVTVTCSSKPAERQHCPADTSKGVALGRSMGEAPCLLGKSWGYDDRGVWVSDGCSAEFILGQGLPEAMEKVEAAKDKAQGEKKPLQYIPNIGFLLVSGEKGEMYVRLFSYVRYLNQKGLDPTYTDAFGNTKSVQQRQDFQLNKFFLPFSGWFLTPKFRYYLYVWSSNPSQGDPAQVVGAGNLSYTMRPGPGCGPGRRPT